MRKMSIPRVRVLLGLMTLMLLACLGTAPAAMAGMEFELNSLSNTTAKPGGSFTFRVIQTNVGNAGSDGSPVEFTGVLPPDLTPVAAVASNESMACSIAAQTVSCAGSEKVFFGVFSYQIVKIETAVDPSASGIVTASFSTQGGGAPLAQTADPVRISEGEPGFGIDAFDGLIGDPSGHLFTRAAGHPYSLSTEYDFNTHTDPNPVVGPGYPVEDLRDLSVELPAGMVGSARDLPQCTSTDLITNALQPNPLCPLGSQVGTVTVRTSETTIRILPVYNMVPPPAAPARFAFNLNGIAVILDAALVNNGGEYRLATETRNVAQVLGIAGNSVEFWGIPGDPRHDSRRQCPGETYPGIGGKTCADPAERQAFFRTPTSCTGEGLEFGLEADSWQQTGKFAVASYRSHEVPGYPYPEEEGPEGEMSRVWGPEKGMEGCAEVPFEPSVSVEPTTDRADSPAGLSVDLGLPAECWEPMATVEEVEDAICQSDLKKAVVTLPQGLTINAAAASGREGCSPAQIGLTSPVGAGSPVFDQAPDACPNASKIGTVEIATPLLKESLHGNLYLAQQDTNPFGSLLGIYLVAEGSGVRIKQGGEISLDPSSGRVTATFDRAPQLPFSNLRLEFFGGPRAALRTPPSCGAYQSQATLTPWSGNAAVQLQSGFTISQGCGGGFDPTLSAGTENSRAGADSPFNLRLTREDGTQEIGALQLTLPPGLISSIRGYTYCPEAALAGISASLGTGKALESEAPCPASSFVGTATVGAGAGVDPFYATTGRAYIAGPYKGAPISLAVVVPAVAGPFDLGSVMVRNPVYIDPSNAQLTLKSDPLPQILHGIPLDLRDIRVRYNHVLNPTNCEPMEVTSTVTSVQGATASPSAHFQAASCDRLGFKPKLSLQLSGPTHRAAHPRLHAVLRTRPGDANIGNTTVLLPRTELLENAHIRTICTRVQYNAGAGGGAGCPKGSIYGYAKAWTPVLDQPLQGPVYLRANGGERELPDLVASLSGQIHIDLVGYIDAVHQRIRNRFEVVPDAPVTKFELTMQGGKKGLLANNTNLCKAKPSATVTFGAQNGKTLRLQPLVKSQCGKGAPRH